MTTDTQLEIAYRLLSASFCQPSEAWREEDIFFRLGESLKAVSPENAAKAAVMWEMSMNRSGDDLSAEYARLFVGPFALKAPPYGSVYLEPGRRVMGETTAAVNRVYEGAGLSLDGESAEMPDHMALELEFMSYLLQKAIRAEAAGDSEGYSAWVGKRRSFLDAYLSRWYGDFCETIRKGTDNRFYLSLADCLEGVVRRDMEVLSVDGECA